MVAFEVARRPSDFDGVSHRYYVGRRFCYWQAGTRALGTMIWDRPLEADIAEMVPFFEVGASPRFAGHRSFVDGRRIEGVDLLALEKLMAYLRARRAVWGPHVASQAILHPGGFTGVVVSGVLHVASPPYPFRCFPAEDALEAFRWSGVEALFEPLEALREAVSSTPDIVRRVRALFEERGSISTGEVARALALSTRTLQRRLEGAGTSLRLERQRHVSTRIEALLSNTDLDLDAIAAEVGLASSSHLVRCFQSTHGTTPGAFRERVRRRADAL